MAIYMLGFSSYEGFCSMLDSKTIKEMQFNERISMYVKQILKNCYAADDEQCNE